MRRGPVWGLGLAVALTLGVSGCSDDPSDDVEIDSSARPEASPGSVPVEPEDGRTIRGADAAQDEAEHAVTQVWFQFYEELRRMYHEVDVDPARFAELAGGDAYEFPAAYVRQLETTRHRNDGGLLVAVTGVEVTDDEAVVTGCVRSSMVEVDAKGKRAGEPDDPSLVSTERLVRTDGRWTVQEHDLTAGRCSVS